ncbi:MAG: aminomethyl-transferring glycine dehydrogenase subunit GcvPA [Endomicrobium sp.]|jgi:glycine dehydrogenase subunit 1|nr:aminomethyl-transferring glycine dehydrogenase subunit GcvPA [Endomicrobium sp.]
MDFTLQNKKDKHDMLKAIGIKNIKELFDLVIQKILKIKKINISGGKTEQELLNYFSNIALTNKVLTSFRGAGIYDHFIPSLVGEIIGRSEFWTSYTPYQAEASQGTLQAIFEYQSLICALTGMDTANASLYDGATAVTEAILLAIRVNKKNKILISSALHPEYIQTIKTYFENYSIKIIFLPISKKKGNIEKSIIDMFVDDDTIAVIIQSPNYFGVIEDMKTLSFATKLKNKKSMFIAVVNPISLAIFQSPSEYDADIAVGEGQSLGITMSVGGNTCGFMTVKKTLEWKMPGRIVGQSIDKNNQRGFVLTLQSREQHIKGGKATSNICTNSSLNALAGCVFLSGWGGDIEFKNLAKINVSKARYAFEKIKTLNGFKSKFHDNFFLMNS